VEPGGALAFWVAWLNCARRAASRRPRSWLGVWRYDDENCSATWAEYDNGEAATRLPPEEAAFGLGGSASAFIIIRGGLESKVGMGCAASASPRADRSSGGSMNSAAPSSAAESVMAEGLPRVETAKSSSNSSP